jgi:alpha-N-acetylglucosaminidase
MHPHTGLLRQITFVFALLLVASQQEVGRLHAEDAASALRPIKADYTSFQGEKVIRFAWLGRNVAIQTVRQDLDPKVMKGLCDTFDKVYDFYRDATQREPAKVKLFQGHTTITEIEKTCGAGCGNIGATGIEIMPGNFEELYDGFRKHGEIDQVLPYEFGRNFWFYSLQLAPLRGAYADSIITGYAVFMRFMALDEAGAKLGPFSNRSGKRFREEVETLVDRYVADPSLNLDNTLAQGRGPANRMNLGSTDLFASFCFRLCRDHGGANYAAKLWQAVEKRPRARTTQDGIDNFVIAASTAAGEDLAPLFSKTWRWTVSDAAKRETAKLAAKAAPAKSSDSRSAVTAARSLVNRILPSRGDDFVLESIPRADGLDVFELESAPENNKIVVRGSTGVAIASGLNWYLKHYCFCQVSWSGDQLKLPHRLPRLEKKIRIVTPYRYREYFNYCTFGYTMAWWDWTRWEREIDWMALSGINMPMAVLGQESVWQSVYGKMGLTNDDLKGFFVGPAFAPWGWMGNLDAWGGPLPQSFIDKQRKLQKRIVARQRELGMEPALPAFSGHVPSAIKSRFPEAKIKQLAPWAGFPGVFILDAQDPLFERIGKAYLVEQTRAFGTDHLYSCDTFNELRPPTNDPDYLKRSAQAVFRAMTVADPQARWVMQGWLFFFDRGFWQPPQIRGLLSGVPDDRMILLDLHSDCAPQWKTTNSFEGKPWIWCLLHNFGAHRAMFGNLEVVSQDPPAALADPKRGQLCGAGMTPEGIEQNAVVYDLMTDMFWRREAPDLDRWLADYAHRRYGKALPQAEEAWKLLWQTVYNRPRGTTSVPFSVVCEAPSLSAGGDLYYSPIKLMRAWQLLDKCSSELGSVPSYRYDLADVGRQVLSNLAGPLSAKVAAAYDAKNQAAFRAATQNFLQLIDDTDALVSTQESTLLGKWIKDAKSHATNDAERKLYEWNARTQITLWGPPNGILRDYAVKEWGGMLHGFYHERWHRYFAALETSLNGGMPFNGGRFDRELRAWEDQWTRQTDSYPDTPTGDAVAISSALLKKYVPVIETSYQFEQNLTTGKPVTVSGGSQPGHPPEMAVDGIADRSSSWWAAPWPQWLQVDLEKTARIGSIDLFTYWDGGRSYQYTIETSLDGKTWTQAVDMSGNTKPATAAGDHHAIKPTDARYVRVNMLHNNANEGVHIAEIRVYPAEGTAKSGAESGPPAANASEAALREKLYDIDGLTELSGKSSPLTDGMTIDFFGDSITWLNGYITSLNGAIASGEGTKGKRIKLVNRGINGGGVQQVHEGAEGAGYPGNSPQAAFAKLIASDKADVAVVFIGINDVWWRKTAPDAFEKAMRDIAAEAKANHTKLVLATLTVHGELPDGKNADDAKIDQFAEITRKVARDTGATLVDLRSAYAAFLHDHNSSTAAKPSGILTYDGVHPNGDGVKLLANLIADGIFRALTSPASATGTLNLIPWPKSVELSGGELVLTKNSRIVSADASLIPLGAILADEIARLTGFRPAVVADASRPGDISLGIDRKLKDEAYNLAVADQAIIRGADYNAVATGTVTLLQAIQSSAGKTALPCLVIADRPALKYRGAMLDIARKPHSLAALRECVDIARFYKVRYIHLHMSDENAWTFPSKKFPQLGKNNFAWAGGEKPEVYKLDDLKQLVAYADARGVTLVPELETPGHSGQIRGTMPEIFGYKTSDGKIESPGVINIASDDALAALDVLVGEFAAVFKSSPYIHIGCDESSVAGIEKYPAVKARMTKMGLHNAGEVFADYVNRMAAIVKKHGKQTIVWQDAPVGPNTDKSVICMSWREGSGAAGNYVAQGFQTIESQPEEKLGGSGPLYLGTETLQWQYTEDVSVSHMRYIASRACDQAWNPDKPRDNYEFLRRQIALEPVLDKLLSGVTFDPQGMIDPLSFAKLDPMFAGRLTLTPDTRLAGGKVHYTLDEGEPAATSPVADKSIQLTSSAILKARWFDDRGRASLYPFVRQYRRLATVKNDALGAKVTLSPGFNHAKPAILTDGFLAAGDSYDDPGWICWSGSGGVRDITLELSKPTEVRTIRGHFDSAYFGLVLPKSVEFEVSGDGKKFRSMGTADQAAGQSHRGWYSVELASPVFAHYVRLRATPGGEWTYVDEVMVNGQLPEPNFPHAAVGRPVTLATKPANPVIGLASLTDGNIGRTPQYQCPGYMGFYEVPIDATIDLGKPVEIHLAGGHFVQQAFGGVYIPAKLEVLVSDDNKTFTSAGTVVPPRNKLDHVENVQVDCHGVKARYVRFKFGGAAQWMFLDQLFVNPAQ